MTARRRHEQRRYLPLADYGLIGDCHTAALVGIDGSIDWLCQPRFDSPSLFARLLDAERGGYFSIAPTDDHTSSFAYWDDSGVLITTFRVGEAEARLIDFMAVEPASTEPDESQPVSRHRVIRLLEGVRGAIDFAVTFRPRPGYAAEPAGLVAEGGGTAIAGDGFRLRAPCALTVSSGDAEGRLRLEPGDRLAFELDLSGAEAPAAEPEPWQCLRDTLRFWRGWSAGCHYEGPYRQAVLRSAITLKLLTYAPTGAMVAAPTTSLPEAMGGERNWDYRYTWIRDASLAAFALFEAGHTADAERFMAWVARVAESEEGQPTLRIMYDVDGSGDLPEAHLTHLEGYGGSSPVRVGNHASEQFQLDVYGYLLDAFNAFRLLDHLPHDRVARLWPAFRMQVDEACRRWRRPDAGIWEARQAPMHYVSSKILAWVAIDRGIRIAEEEALDADVAHWRAEREAIIDDVLAQGLDPEGGGFSRAYGQPAPDASNLLAVLTHFVNADDPRMRRTIQIIEEQLAVGDLVYRYRQPDGLPGDEGAFLVASFWLIDVYLSQGRLDEARDRFERMLDRASPLGLYAEEMDPRTGAFLGNYPQALTHLGLINVAVNLARAGVGRVPPMPEERLDGVIGADRWP